MPLPSRRCGRARTRAECTCAPSPVGPRRASPGCVSASWSSPSRKPAPPRPAAAPHLLPVALSEIFPQFSEQSASVGGLKKHFP
eukprot:881581-Prymnesium_polylepis.1